MEEHWMQIVIQAMLALAVFSFLEYSIHTLHTPTVVNRRARLICAAGLTLGVLGLWVMLFNRPFGVIMAIVGNLIAVVTMRWVETTARTSRPESKSDINPDDPESEKSPKE